MERGTPIGKSNSDTYVRNGMLVSRMQGMQIGNNLDLPSTPKSNTSLRSTIMGKNKQQQNSLIQLNNIQPVTNGYLDVQKVGSPNAYVLGIPRTSDTASNGSETTIQNSKMNSSDNQNLGSIMDQELFSDTTGPIQLNQSSISRTRLIEDLDPSQQHSRSGVVTLHSFGDEYSNQIDRGKRDNKVDVSINTDDSWNDLTVSNTTHDYCKIITSSYPWIKHIIDIGFLIEPSTHYDAWYFSKICSMDEVEPSELSIILMRRFGMHFLSELACGSDNITEYMFNLIVKQRHS